MEIRSGQHVLLLHICDGPGTGQDALAEHLQMNKSTVARALIQLERDGWIRREAKENDLRAFLLYPSEKALSAASAIREAARAWDDSLAQGLTREERRFLSAAMYRMAENALRCSRFPRDGGKTI